MVLSPFSVLRRGLEMEQNRQRKGNPEWQFKRLFGSSPTVIADVWCQVLPTLDEKDKSPQGFRKFMIAQHFLWAYPKNATVLAELFQGVGLKVVQGSSLWNMVAKIAALVQSKVEWDPNQNSMDQWTTQSRSRA